MRCAVLTDTLLAPETTPWFGYRWSRSNPVDRVKKSNLLGEVRRWEISVVGIQSGEQKKGRETRYTLANGKNAKEKTAPATVIPSNDAWSREESIVWHAWQRTETGTNKRVASQELRAK